MHPHHHTNEDYQSQKNIGIAFFLNVTFAIIEFIGGILTNSVAILSDALHDFGDSISLGFAWYLQRFSQKKSNENYTYGYRRFTLLGALINAVILTVGSIFILHETIPRLFNPQPAHAQGMMLLAVLGITVNGIAVWRLRRGKSLNEKVVSLHLWEDVLGWVTILVGSIVMHFFNVPILDPLLSLGISLYILWNVFKNLKLSLHIILQGAPEEAMPEKIKNIVLQYPQISAIHHIHSWSIDGNSHIATFHVVLHEKQTMDKLHELKRSLKNNLQKTLQIHHATIEFEAEDETCD